MTKKAIILNTMIDQFRKEQDLTLEELGAQLGKSKSAISRWIKGDRSPMVEDLEKLASLFQTDIQTLLYGHTHVTISKELATIIQLTKTLPKKEQQTIADYTQTIYDSYHQQLRTPTFPVPVIEALAAGRGYSYGDNEMTVFYTTRTDLKHYDLASLVSGDSMTPLIQDGDVVLIKKNTFTVNGKLYAIDYDGKSYLKKVFFEDDHLRLVSLNEKYDDIIIPTNDDAYLNVVGEIVDWFTPVVD